MIGARSPLSPPQAFLTCKIFAAGVQNSRELREGAQALVARATDMAKLMLCGEMPEHPLAGGGRKAHELDSEQTG